jgi:hypothetical protein
MTCSYIYQHLYSYAQFSVFKWRNDKVLETPTLVWPEDGVNLCEDNFGEVPGGSSNFNLTWNAVPGAAFYIIQWCRNSSFRGPTLQAQKVTATSSPSSTTHNLVLTEQIRLDDQIFWRVMAHDNQGGVSEKSETRSFKYQCSPLETDSSQGKSEDRKKKQPGGKSGGTSPHKDLELCDFFQIKMDIVGPKEVMCTDKQMWHLELSYTCNDANARQVASITATEWSVVNNPKKVGIFNIIVGNDKVCVLQIFGNESEVIGLKAKVTFFDHIRQKAFECEVEKKVRVDCHTGKPSYKPWLDLCWKDIYTVHTDYVRSTLDAGQSKSTSIDGKTVLTGGTRILTGPVFRTSLSKLTPEPPDTCIEDHVWGMGLEAAVHVPDNFGTGGSVCYDNYTIIHDDSACLKVDNAIAESVKFYSLDPSTISFSISGCNVTWAGTITEYDVHRNGANFLLSNLTGVTHNISEKLSLAECLQYCDCPDVGDVCADAPCCGGRGWENVIKVVIASTGSALPPFNCSTPDCSGFDGTHMVTNGTAIHSVGGVPMCGPSDPVICDWALASFVTCTLTGATYDLEVVVTGTASVCEGIFAAIYQVTGPGTPPTQVAEWDLTSSFCLDNFPLTLTGNACAVLDCTWPATVTITL